MNCSDAASTSGWSAVEPTAVMLPDRFFVSLELESVVDVLPPPQAARPRPASAAALPLIARKPRRVRLFDISVPPETGQPFVYIRKFLHGARLPSADLNARA